MADSIAAVTAGSAVVTSALKKASTNTGVGFDYLYRVAMRESSLNPEAKAQTSSAAGLFQFIEQTWLGAVKKYGAAHGLGAYAADIESGANGKLTVASTARRQEILDLRFDPEKAAALAGELALENKNALEDSLGRAVDGAELYAAHFLGAGGAKKLLSAAPDQSAASLLPSAARANRHVFFDGARERTVDEVMTSFRKTIGAAKEAINSLGDRIEKSLAPLLRDEPFAPFRAMNASFEGVRAPERAAQVSIGRAPTLTSPKSVSAKPASETFASTMVESRGPFEVKGLSPLALAVLQALDPRDIGSRGRK